MKTIETLLKEVRKSLKKADEVYYGDSWNAAIFDDRRVIALRKKKQLDENALKSCVELLSEINLKLKIDTKLLQEAEINVLIPKIDQE